MISRYYNSLLLNKCIRATPRCVLGYISLGTISTSGNQYMIVFTGIWNENSSLLYPASHHLHTKRGVYPLRDSRLERVVEVSLW